MVTSGNPIVDFGLFAFENKGNIVAVTNCDLSIQVVITDQFGILAMRTQGKTENFENSQFIAENINANLDVAQKDKDYPFGIVISEGALEKIILSQAVFTGKMSSNTNYFGILGNDGAGTIKIDISDFEVNMVLEIRNANTVSLLWNNFRYTEDSIISVENVMFDGVLTTGDLSGIFAFNSILSENVQYSFINVSNHAEMQFTGNRLLFNNIFENVTSTNTDKGNIWCQAPEILHLVHGHCSESGESRLSVEYDSGRGSKAIWDEKFSDPGGDVYYMFDNDHSWNHTSFIIKTSGQGEGETSPFRKQKVLFIDVEIIMTVGSTGHWGCALVRQPEKEL